MLYCLGKEAGLEEVEGSTGFKRIIDTAVLSVSKYTSRQQLAVVPMVVSNALA